MIEKEQNTTEVLKQIVLCQSHEQFMEIGESNIISCMKQHFPVLVGDRKTIDLKESNIYTAVKKLVQNYQNLTNTIHNSQKNEYAHIIGAQFKQKPENIDFQSRKNTRATLAMRNSKNQQQLKKDQIFVRLIPRTHNCIHFMVKNHNFPRIECRLSCNQHLEYLLTYLTNKWLRGKVGVGYQIKLYPDPSTYMQRHSQETKRPAIIHEPLNNYLMFTDIMAAFGVAQNGCVNLLYDITELRKEKEKEKYGKIAERDNQLSSENYGVKIQKQPESSALEQFKQYTASPHKKYSTKLLPTKPQQKSNQLQVQLQLQEQMSIGVGLSKEKKGYNHIGNNSIDYSDANSLGYQFNAFNSNQILGTLFNMNNSNTFLNLCGGDNNNNNNNIKNNNGTTDNPMSTPTKTENKQGGKNSSGVKNSPTGTSGLEHLSAGSNNNNSNNNNNGIGGTQNPVPENKLDNIRNFINIIEKQVGPIISQPVPQVTQKQENSMHKSQSNFLKKQVKTVTIIKKKNQAE